MDEYAGLRPQQVGVQIPRSVHPERSSQGAVRAPAAAPWRSVPGIGATEGESGRGRAHDNGSRAHDAVDSAEVRGIARGGVCQGQERDPSGTGVRRAESQFRRAVLLGPRILRFDGGSGRGDDSGVHPQSGARRRKVGAAESVALSGRREGGPSKEAALAAVTCRFERLTI
jgi:hypothetical protein